MMTRILIPAVLLVAITAPLVHAQTHPSTRDMELAKHLYYSSPSKMVSDNVGNGINEMIKNIRTQLGGNTYHKEMSQVADTMHAAFSLGRIRAMIVQHLAKIIADEPKHVSMSE